jgi:hypothetical protein
MSRRVRFLLSLTLIVLSTSSAGCHKYVVVRQSLSPIPEEANGVLYIATNDPIPVGIEGTDTVDKLDVGGYYLMHKNDLKALVQAAKKGQAK